MAILMSYETRHSRKPLPFSADYIARLIITVR